MNISKNKLSFSTLIVVRNLTTTLGAALFMVVGVSSVQALEIKEGKWGITTETNAPMVPEPIVEYLEECMEGEFDPIADLLEETIEGCEIETVEDSANKLELIMQCEIPGAGNMDGNILFTVNGESANGQMDMVMNMGGMSMNVGSTWTGEYLGACSQ